MPCPLFDRGHAHATPGAVDALAAAGQSPVALLERHTAGDWGDLGDDDKAANAVALQVGSRILSAYVLATGVKAWVLTEAEDDDGRRAATTILLPDEY
jgi:hypothetical protein